MNRQLIVAAIGFVVAVAIGSHFYVEWQMAKFDASLPTPPAAEEQQRIEETADDTAGDTAGGHWHGDEWHAEPHVDEAPRVQPVTAPAAEVTAETEAARRRIEALELPPSELDLELEAIQADLKALLEQRGTLSLAEFEKGLDDIARRGNAWDDKFDKQAEETAVFIRERAAEQQEAVGPNNP